MVSHSWMSPEIAWSSTPGTFVITISCDDRDVVAFIADGVIDVDLASSRNSAVMMAGLLGPAASLLGELAKATTHPKMLRSDDWRTRIGSTVSAYFVTGILLPPRDRIALLVSRSPPTASNHFPEDCKAKAKELVAAHRRATEDFDTKMNLKRQQSEAFHSRPEMSPYKPAADFGLAQEAMGRPILTPNDILSLLPKGTVLTVSNSTAREIQRRAAVAISTSGLPPSRDGTYSGFLPGSAHKGAIGFIVWKPYSGAPSYPELMAALQKRLPRAFANPRLSTQSPPKLDLSRMPVTAPVDLAESASIDRILEDLSFDPPDIEARSDRLKQDLQGYGFEAIAWYQSHHFWTDDTWGIYIDAAKLDDLAGSIFQDLKTGRGYVPFQLSAFISLGLILEHELFHAKLEAAASWLELAGLKPRYRHYSNQVYDTLRGTADWLEEALANWSAWEWFKSDPVQHQLTARYGSVADRLERIVESILDLSPPGYRDWRLGRSQSTWRKLSSQLVQGRSGLHSRSIGLPLESLLSGPLPYDLHTNDIPIRFLGSGIIADRLLSRPASFHVPPRSELERALKFFKHARDPSSGKGSHEKWTGPDQRAFMLPKRDPVSPGVFRTFLHHVGIDKSTYVHNVRPNL